MWPTLNSVVLLISFLILRIKLKLPYYTHLSYAEYQLPQSTVIITIIWHPLLLLSHTFHHCYRSLASTFVMPITTHYPIFSRLHHHCQCPIIIQHPLSLSPPIVISSITFAEPITSLSLQSNLYVLPQTTLSLNNCNINDLCYLLYHILILINWWIGFIKFYHFF